MAATLGSSRDLQKDFVSWVHISQAWTATDLGHMGSRGFFLDTRRGSYPRRWFIETKTTEKRHNRPDEFKREAVLLLETQLRR
jgi:hypothetical protein